MVPTFVIDPSGVYDDSTLILGLELSSTALVTARRRGHLRHARKGRRILYLGKWVLEWLESSTAKGGETT